MPAQNLIGLKQLRQDQISGFVSGIASTIASSIATGITGNLGTFTSGVETSLVSGATSVVISYSITPAPKVWAGIGYSGGLGFGNIGVYPGAKNTTGCTFNFGATIPSTGYYLEVLIKP